jgi:ribosomal protein L11 methyltransferase
VVTDYYIEICVCATAETEEGLSDFLFSEGALGLLTEDIPEQSADVLIRASFAGSVAVRPLIERIKRYQDSLAALGFPKAVGDVKIRELPLQDWGHKWKENFKPLPVGRRLLIAPPWESVPFLNDRLVIWIDPAMAFGTGHHATTQMCLQSLERFMDQWVDTRRPVVLDVGTGTGILAIAAAALGAERVVAIDTDPEACDAARRNLVRCERRDRIEIIYGRIDTLNRNAPFDLILANLDTRTLSALFPPLAGRLTTTGHLVISGIPIQDEAAITSSLQSVRLHVIDRQEEADWLCLTLVAQP